MSWLPSGRSWPLAGCSSEWAPGSLPGVPTRGARRSATLADLITNHTTNSGATHGSQHAATTDGGAGHTAHARARHSAFLPAAHIVPGRATYCRYCQNCNCACFSERLKIHELTPYDGWPMSVFRTLPAVQQKPDPILRVHAVPSHVAGQPGVIEFEKCNYGSAAGPCN